MCRALVLSSLLGLTLVGPLSAFASTRPFRCAGVPASTHLVRAAKPLDQTPVPVTGDRRVLIIFARFADDPTGWTTVPAWAAKLLDPAVPGSLAHYYDTMSFGLFRLRGEVAPRCYAAPRPATAYLPAFPGEPSRYGEFALAILAQADQEVDFSRFDDEGPDRVPGSADDDGIVDAVFLVLADVPFGFLAGGATGIAALGFSEPFVTDDRTAGGAAVRVLPIQGTVQQAATSAQAAGALAHEYGHLLRLPDLYDTPFLQTAGAPPEEDSAGAGNWCLMGWGAGGWQANDGPTSLCAWSRLQLGWAAVTEPAAQSEELRLPEVGRRGDLYRIPIGGQSAFLFEYRRRTSTWYDRHLPAEGLLIWRVDSVNRAGIRLDLECADGRWLDAGYPLGQRPDSLNGGDNLDYWAHDAAYAAAHAGNLGDATDPFGSNRYTAFTPETNPSSDDPSLLAGIRVEGIRLDGDLARARVQVRPAKLELQWLYAIDETGDELLVPGEKADFRFSVVNSGNVAVQNVRVIASVVDPELELVTAEADFGTIPGGATQRQPVDGRPFPAVRLAPGFSGRRQLMVTLTVHHAGQVVGEWPVTLSASSTLPLTGTVTDEEGTGLADIPLELHYHSSSGAAKTYRLTTAADGTYALDLPPGEYEWTYSDQYPAGFPAERAIPYGHFTLTAAAALDLVLPRTYPLQGRVTDALGKPLPGVTVQVQGLQYVATTSPDGTWHTKVPAGRRELQLYRHTTNPRDRLPHQRFSVTVDGPTTFDIVLQDPVTLTVAVTDPQGLPSPSARVDELLGFSYTTGSTDATGRLALLVRPGLVSLLVADGAVSRLLPPFAVQADTLVEVVLPRALQVSGVLLDSTRTAVPGGAFWLLPLGVPGQSPLWTWVNQEGAFTTWVTSGRLQGLYTGTAGTQLLAPVIELPGSSSVELAIPPSRVGQGWLVDQAGQPLAGVTIRARSLAGMQSMDATRADGTFELHQVPGRCDLAALGEGTALVGLGSVDWPPAEPVVLQLPSEDRLTGRVQGAGRIPARGALVTLTTGPEDLTWATPTSMLPMERYWGLGSGSSYELSHLVERQAVVQGTPGLAAAAVTDPRGRYLLPAMPGRYTVIALPGCGRGIGTISRVDLRGDQTLDLTLPLPAQVCRIYGAITSLPDEPREYLVLRAIDAKAGVVAQSVTYGWGVYLLEAPPGEYRVYVGLATSAQGIHRVYDAGRRRFDLDQQWDIDLSAAPTAVAEAAGASLPAQTRLLPNCPNPFNGATLIRYELATSGMVRLAVYNILGQRVRELVAAWEQAGPHTVTWDGRDQDGRAVGTGVYLCRLQAGHQVQVRRMLLLE